MTPLYRSVLNQGKLLSKMLKSISSLSHKQPIYYGDIPNPANPTCYVPEYKKNTIVTLFKINNFVWQCNRTYNEIHKGKYHF